MKAEIKEQWLALAATREVITQTAELRPLVMPAPAGDFNPAYGNWAFGFIQGFETALALIRNGGEMLQPAQLPRMAEDWGTALLDPQPNTSSEQEDSL